MVEYVVVVFIVEGQRCGLIRIDFNYSLVSREADTHTFVHLLYFLLKIIPAYIISCEIMILLLLLVPVITLKL